MRKKGRIDTGPFLLITKGMSLTIIVTMRQVMRIFLGTILVLLVVGCSQVSNESPVTLTAMAPDFLKNIIDRAAAQFQQENGVLVNLIYVNPDSVTQLTKARLDADLFLSVNSKRFDILRRDTLLVDSLYSCPFKLSLVMGGRADGPSGEKLADLKQDRFRRVVLLDPMKRYEGKMAATVLNRKKLWNDLSNKLIIAESVDHLHSFLATKEADAAVMFESSMQDQKNLVILQRLDNELKERLVVCGAVTPQSKNKKVAQAFIDLLDSPQCQIYKIKGVNRYTGR